MQTKLSHIPSLLLAIVALAGFMSCGKNLVPSEVSGLGDVLKKATESLNGIAGADAGAAVDKAKEALPQLEDTGAQLEKVQGLMGKLPGPAKEAVAKVIGEHGEKILALLEKVSAIPGVSGVIQPALDKIKSGLTQLKG